MSRQSSGWDGLLPRLERVLDLLEERLHLGGVKAAPASGEALAFRWNQGHLETILNPDIYPHEDLIGVDTSLARLRANIAAFCRGDAALDMLLYGERGTGKSSAVRGLLQDFGPIGLRIVEIRRDDLFELHRLYEDLRKLPGRVLIFCDDLSFEEGDRSYTELKTILEGGLEARPDHVLLAATSNRRYLIPERASENREAVLDADGELHPGETTEVKLSVSDRFGLLLPFFSFNQETYLKIVDHHAHKLGLTDRLETAEMHARALRFALERSSRSGRTARQACIVALQELEGSRL